MQVQEVSAQGLRREYKITVPANDIAKAVDERILKLSKTAKMPGFRPGKVPPKLLKKQHGRSVMGEVLEKAVEDGSKKAIDENSLKPALRPKIEVTSFDEGKDLEFKMDLEVLPEVPEIDVKGIELERPVTPVGDKQVQESIDRIAESRRSYTKVDEDRACADGDQVLFDFEGKVDGETFEGGSAEGFELVLGSGRMIPGFEDGIAGMKAGEEKSINVTFPEGYAKAELAGKPAVFAIKLSEIRAPGELTIDDEFAKSMGAENVDDLKAKVRERIESEYKGFSRARVKRSLLDVLAERHVFEVPAGMVDLEFEAIWKQLEDEMKRTEQSFEDMGQSEEETKTEYRGIAERRVRLGLILSDIGTKNEVKVEPQEVQAEMINQARRFPGQEKEIFDYFRNTPGALEQLRAPIFEDKVVDFILEIAKVTDKEVAVEELMRDPDEEDAAASNSSGGDDAGEKSS